MSFPERSVKNRRRNSKTVFSAVYNGESALIIMSEERGSLSIAERVVVCP